MTLDDVKFQMKLAKDILGEYATPAEVAFWILNRAITDRPGLKEEWQKIDPAEIVAVIKPLFVLIINEAIDAAFKQSKVSDGPN